MSGKARKTNGTWRDLKDGSGKARRGSPMSGKAKLRIAWIWTKRAFWITLFIGLCLLLFLLWKKMNIEDFAADYSNPISRIEFKTDGAVSGDWLNKFLSIPRKTKLSDVNIFDVKMSLEKVEQIKSAEVERAYPDILRIKIKEHKPILKAIFAVNGIERIYAMSDEGIFFTPICLPPEFLASLIRLKGAPEILQNGIPQPCADAGKIVEFLGHAQAHMPQELKNWREIDISQLHSRVLPVFEVRTSLGTKIIFRDSNYKKQFDNLEYVLRYAKEKYLNSIERIDLTPEGMANVKLSGDISK